VVTTFGDTSMLHCPCCNKAYSYKKALEKHTVGCSVNGNNAKIEIVFAYCNKKYKSTVWLNKHQANCRLKSTHDNSVVLTTCSPVQQSCEIFPFSEYFLANDFFLIDNAVFAPSDDNWLNELTRLSLNKTSNFFLLNLSINSAFSKVHLISEIAQKIKPDILFLNETKIDQSVQDAAVEMYGYNLFRRDRTARGGGILI
jgi:hypothetical protein